MIDNKSKRPPIIRPGWLVRGIHRGETWRGEYLQYPDNFCLVKYVCGNGSPEQPGRLIIGYWGYTIEGALNAGLNNPCLRDPYTWSAASDNQSRFEVLSTKIRGLGFHCIVCGRQRLSKIELFNSDVYECPNCGDVDPFHYILEDEKQLLDAVEAMDNDLPIKRQEQQFQTPPLTDEDFCFD